MMRQWSPRGFSLLELMLTVAMLGVLTAILIPIYQTFQVKNGLDVAVNETVSALRRAQFFSQGMQRDSAWGVYLQSESVTLYKGTSYSARDATYDEMVAIPATVTASGLLEVNYGKMTGLPSATGTMTFTSSTGLVRTIIINAKGMLAY